jgi:hypothetical protein
VHKKLMVTILVVVIVVSCLGFLTINNAAACYTYTLTSNCHDETVLGTSITATAYTSNPDVKQVRFIWRSPSGQEKTWIESVNKNTHKAVSQYTPDSMGEWKITAQFLKQNTNYYYESKYVKIDISDFYALTLNCTDGAVEYGDGVKVTAFTTNADVAKVRFTWYNPSGQKVKVETVNVYTNTTKIGGKLVRYADSCYTPDALGDWKVTAEFLKQDSYHGGCCCCCCKDKTLPTKCVSFHVIPEVPFLGAGGAVIAMVFGAVYVTKRKTLAAIPQ